MSKPKHTEATEANEATEAIERVGLAELVSRAKAAAAAEVERMQVIGHQAARTHLDKGEIEEAATIIGTKAVAATLMDRKLAAADEVVSDDQARADRARADLIAARDGLALLGTLEELDAITYNASTIERAMMVGAIAASLAEQFPSTLRVALVDTKADEMAIALLRLIGAHTTGRSGKDAGNGASNRRQAWHIAAAIGGETFEMNESGATLAGYISHTGAIVATHWNGLPIESTDVLGTRHAEKEAVAAQLDGSGTWTFTGTLGKLSSLLASESAGPKASRDGWKTTVLTSGIHEGKRIHDVVPFPR